MSVAHATIPLTSISKGTKPVRPHALVGTQTISRCYKHPSSWTGKGTFGDRNIITQKNKGATWNRKWFFGMMPQKNHFWFHTFHVPPIGGNYRNT